MIAHSLPDEVFGRAQGTHGATFIVDVSFFRKDLNEYNIVVNSGLAHEAVKAVLAPLKYANLDQMPEMKGQLTTAEFLARYIFNLLAEVIADGMLGADGKALKASSSRSIAGEPHIQRRLRRRITRRLDAQGLRDTAVARQRGEPAPSTPMERPAQRMLLAQTGFRRQVHLRACSKRTPTCVRLY